MNLFNLCVFGKLVEETEGGSGVWFTYIVTALGELSLEHYFAGNLPVHVHMGGVLSHSIL